MANRTKRTPEKRQAFLQTLSRTCIVRSACAAAGIGRRTAYEWRSADPEFAQAWEDARQEGADVMEEEAMRRAVQGIPKSVYYEGKRVDTVCEYSDTLLIFLLKGARPEKYRERHDLMGAGGAPIQPVLNVMLSGPPAEETKTTGRRANGTAFAQRAINR